jgi:hypothetical protein
MMKQRLLRNARPPFLVVFFLAIAAFTFAGSEAYAQYWDWWGAASVEIAVHVRSAAGGDPIAGASIGIADLDEPRPRESAHGTPAETASDETGTALLQADFDARGSGYLLFGSSGWVLSGKLRVRKEGYYTVDDWISVLTRRLSYPMSVRRIDIEVFLSPADPGREDAPVPITFSPYTGLYTFEGKSFGIDWWGTGCSGLYAAIAASRPMDDDLKRRVDEYGCRLATGEALLWSGLAMAIGGGTVGLIFLKDTAGPQEKVLGYLGLGVVLGGGAAMLTGMFVPGAPTALVDYYNRTRR